jgi:hypothetical protein
MLREIRDGYVPFLAVPPPEDMLLLYCSDVLSYSSTKCQLWATWTTHTAADAGFKG